MDNHIITILAVDWLSGTSVARTIIVHNLQQQHPSYLPREYTLSMIQLNHPRYWHNNRREYLWPTQSGFLKYLTTLTRYGRHEWLKQLLVSSRVLLEHRHARLVARGSFVLHHSRKCLETINICIVQQNKTLDFCTLYCSCVGVVLLWVLAVGPI